MCIAEKYREATALYYSKWLGQDGILNHDWKGIEYLYSQQRNTVQYGYSDRFDLYALCQKDRIVISYGDRAENQLEVLKSEIHKPMPAEEVRKIMEKSFRQKACDSIKFVFESPREIPSAARVLTEKDYRDYEDFWLKCNPGCSDTGWLKEYFEEMAQENMCIGVYVDGRIVSCTDAPGMPYMEEQVQEIGINTLKDYRGKGYASMACARCIREMTDRHKVPMWSTSTDNTASRRLAGKTGFAEYAEVISMTL